MAQPHTPQQLAPHAAAGPVFEDFEITSLFSTVLLVEDEPAHARLIERALDGFVGDVEHVTTGEAALREIETRLVELVLCDLHLPDGSAVDILRAIRGVRPDLPIVVMTSSSSLDDAVTAMREGAWDYIVKHFSSDFSDRIKIVITRTAQRKLQEMRELQVRAERDAFWTAVRTAQDGLAMLSESGEVIFANDRFQDFLNLLTGAARGEKTPDLIHALERRDAAVAAGLRQQLEDPSRQSYWSSEIELPSSPIAGKVPPRFFELTVNSVSAPGASQIAGHLATKDMFRRSICWVRDITRRKEQERFQRDLLSTTTHDLKGPLGAILTSAELMNHLTPSEDRRLQDLITRIASCARNSITLIDELLSARRIQDGVLVVRAVWQDVREAIDDIILDFMPVARGKSIDLAAGEIPFGLEVFADKLGLNRVLGNLVSNAIKFTTRGGTVRLTAGRSGNSIRISVADSGTGIDPKSRSRLFERYSRLDQHEAIDGTGLGLFVTKNIVDAHNGRIEVTSEEGVGSVFTVYFPDPIRSGEEEHSATGD